MNLLTWKFKEAPLLIAALLFSFKEFIISHKLAADQISMIIIMNVAAEILP